MAVRIAIPVPTSNDPEYNQRSLPPYVDALKAAGAEPVVVPLNEPQEHVARLLAGVQGVLLPGSCYDVDPERYGEKRAPECGEADPARTAADELLLQDAFNLRKPILAICHGAQTLNVWRNGALIQDLEDDGQPPARARRGGGAPSANCAGVEVDRAVGAGRSGRSSSQLQPSSGDSHARRQSACHCGLAKRRRDRGSGTGCAQPLCRSGAVAPRTDLHAKRIFARDFFCVG